MSIIKNYAIDILDEADNVDRTSGSSKTATVPQSPLLAASYTSEYLKTNKNTTAAIKTVISKDVIKDGFCGLTLFDFFSVII